MQISFRDNMTKYLNDPFIPLELMMCLFMKAYKGQGIEVLIILQMHHKNKVLDVDKSAKHTIKYLVM